MAPEPYIYVSNYVLELIVESVVVRARVAVIRHAAIVVSREQLHKQCEMFTSLDSFETTISR